MRAAPSTWDLLSATTLACVLVGCPSAPSPTAPRDAAVSFAEVDAGPAVTAARLDAWLQWHRALATLPARDGGAGELRQRARVEAALLADAGLSDAQADALEAVVAAVVAERSVAKLTGAEALSQFKAGLQALAPEQRAKAEAALADLQARAPQGSLTALEAQFGVDAVRVVLDREAEVTKTWDALLEARGDRR